MVIVSGMTMLRLSNYKRCRVENGLLFYGDVFVDILVADERVHEDVGEHGENEPVAGNVTDGAADVVLDERHDAAADNHSHEQAGSFGGVLAEAFSSEVENAAPHYGCAQTAQDEEQALHRHFAGGDVEELDFGESECVLFGEQDCGEHQQESHSRDSENLSARRHLAADNRAAEATNEHQEPVDGGEGAGHGCSAYEVFAANPDVELAGDADFDTYIEEDGDDAEGAVAEGQRAAFVGDFIEVGLRFNNLDERDDDECEDEDDDTGHDQGGDGGHRGFFGESTNQNADKHRGQRGRQRVEGAANLDELVAFVATAAQEVEHGVDYSVEHADAEAADQSAEQVDEQVESGRCSAVDDDYVSADYARQELDTKADSADSEGDKRGFLVSVTDEHVACGYTHEEVCGEVH